LHGITDVKDDRWHLVIGVFEPADKGTHKRLYIDGCLDNRSDVPLLLRQEKLPVWIGASSEEAGREFGGWIDEVAIFSRALSTKEAAAMFQAGKPVGD
jgi:MSHA biogenesis protein MshQ